MRKVNPADYEVAMHETDKIVLEDILRQSKEDIAATMEDDEFFEFFVAEQVLRDFQLDPDEIKYGLISQSANDSTGSDGGIDAMYILQNGRLIRDVEQAEGLKAVRQNIAIDVIIIQASRETGFDLKRILRLKDTSENIFSIGRQTDQFDEEYNGPLLDCIEVFRAAHRAVITKKPTFQVHYFYVTKGDSTKIAADVESKAESLKISVTTTLATINKCSFTFVGARDLITFYRQTEPGPKILKCVDSVSLAKDGYIGLVKLEDFYRFIASDKNELLEHLFESNVRDYQGNITNEAIATTLADKKR